MKKTTNHSVYATAPRLSDEELDPLEQDDSEGVATDIFEAYVPWDPEDIMDIHRLIHDRMPEKQQAIILAFLNGNTYTDLQVTEKYWRYHFEKGVQYIKKELGI